MLSAVAARFTGWMSTATVEAPLAPRHRTARVTAWLPAVASALAGAGLALFLIWPFYANGLHHLPGGEVAGGGHDPKDLWPLTDDSWVARVFRVGSLLSVLFGPWVAVGAGLVGAYAAVRDRAERSRWFPGAVAGVIALGVVGWLLSPSAAVIFAWYLD